MCRNYFYPRKYCAPPEIGSPEFLGKSALHDPAHAANVVGHPAYSPSVLFTGWSNLHSDNAVGDWPVFELLPPKQMLKGGKNMLREIASQDIDLVAGGLDFRPGDTRSYLPTPTYQDIHYGVYPAYRSFEAYLNFAISAHPYAGAVSFAEVHVNQALSLQEQAVATGTAWEIFEANGEHRGWGFVGGSEGERLIMESYAVQGIPVY
jgi:hypothetical protein